VASARSDTRCREWTTAVGGARGEAVGDGAVGARHVRRRGREAAVGTPARVWRGASAWQSRGDGALTGGPGAGKVADRWAHHVSDF
jgi:hypothetical protein